MNEQKQKMMEMAKDEVVQITQEMRDHVNVGVDLLSRVVAITIQNTHEIGTSMEEAVSVVVRATLYTSLETEGDLGMASKGIVLGVFRGTRESPGDLAEAVESVMREVVRHSAELKGDVALAAKGGVQGAMEAAEEMGLNVREAASAAATSAVKEAYEISFDTGKRVQYAVTGTISGVKVMLQEPFRSVKKSNDLF